MTNWSPMILFFKIESCTFMNNHTVSDMGGLIPPSQTQRGFDNDNI